MRLLPAFTYEGHTISLQDPVVMDGELVTRCECLNAEFDGRSSIMNFSLFTDTTSVIIPADTFNHKCQELLRDYEYYEDDRGQHFFSSPFQSGNTNYSQWFIDRINDPRCITDGRLDRYKCGRRLSYQGRARYDYQINDYVMYPTQHFDVINTTEGDFAPGRVAAYNGQSVQMHGFSDSTDRYATDRNGRRLFNYSGFQSETRFEPSIFSMEFNGMLQPEKKYIHSYNYKPDYIPHYIENENPETTLLLGAEIEVAGNHPETDRRIKEDTVKKCIQIMNGSDSDEESLIYSTHDGTVQIEFDTMPCSLEFHKNKMNYRKMFKYLDSVGYKGHDCDCAGLHIHADRKYLGRTKFQQDLVIAKILYIIEKFNDDLCIIARRNNDYSVFCGDKCTSDTAVTLYGKYRNIGKKAALNLQHSNTIEFRMFRSTLKYETLLLTLELVQDIINFSKNISFEELEDMSWNDLMDTFSDALKRYYISRRNKEFKEKINKSDVFKKEKKKLRKKISDLRKRIQRCIIPMEKSKLYKEMNELQKYLNKLDREPEHTERIWGNPSTGHVENVHDAIFNDTGTLNSIYDISSRERVCGRRAESSLLNDIDIRRINVWDGCSNINNI